VNRTDVRLDRWTRQGKRLSTTRNGKTVRWRLHPTTNGRLRVTTDLENWQEPGSGWPQCSSDGRQCRDGTASAVGDEQTTSNDTAWRRTGDFAPDGWRRRTAERLTINDSLRWHSRRRGASQHMTADRRTTAQLDTVDSVPRLSSSELTTKNEPADTVAVDQPLCLSLG